MIRNGKGFTRHLAKVVQVRCAKPLSTSALACQMAIMAAATGRPLPFRPWRMK